MSSEAPFNPAYYITKPDRSLDPTTEEVLNQTWKCLEQPCHKNGLFTLLFPDIESLIDTTGLTTLSFAPGLLEVLTAPLPPTTTYYKDLPDQPLTPSKWAVYGLVMEHPDLPDPSEHRFYVGSATDAQNGVRSRFSLYSKDITIDYLDSQQLLRDPWPKLVRQALRDGYRITKKVLLASAPLPTAAKVPVLRTLFKALEAAFSFALWAMHSNSSQGSESSQPSHDYGMADCCPWPRKDFAYRGLCSHSSLLEGIIRHFDLTDEEREGVAAFAREQARNHTREWRAANHDLFRAMDNASKRRRLDSRKYFCYTCGVPCSGPYEFDRHEKSRHHLQNVAAVAAGKKNWPCSVCNKWFHSEDNLDRHREGPNHLAAVARAEAAGTLPVEETESLENDEFDEEALRATKSLGPPYHCDTCDKNLKTWVAWFNHCSGRTHRLRVTRSCLPSVSTAIFKLPQATAKALNPLPTTESSPGCEKPVTPPAQYPIQDLLGSDLPNDPLEGLQRPQPSAGLHLPGPTAQPPCLVDEAITIRDSEDESILPVPKRQRRRYHVPVDSDDEDALPPLLPATSKAFSAQGPATVPRSATQLLVTPDAPQPPSQGLLATHSFAPGAPQPRTPTSEEEDEGPYYCHPCKHDYETSGAFKQHQRSKKHTTAVNRLEMGRVYLEDFNRRMAERDAATPAATSISKTESLDSVPESSRRRATTNAGSIIIVSDDDGSSPEVLPALQLSKPKVASLTTGPKVLSTEEVSQHSLATASSASHQDTQDPQAFTYTVTPVTYFKLTFNLIFEKFVTPLPLTLPSLKHTLYNFYIVKPC